MSCRVSSVLCTPPRASRSDGVAATLVRWDGEGAVGWRGRGATIGVVDQWGGEGVAIATGRRRAGVDVATGWRRRRSVWWGRRESWHRSVTAMVLAGRQRWWHPCRWHHGAGWCGGVRWRSDSVGGMTASMGDSLVTRVVACRRVRSTALAAWQLAVTLAIWRC